MYNVPSLIHLLFNVLINLHKDSHLVMAKCWTFTSTPMIFTFGPMGHTGAYWSIPCLAQFPPRSFKNMLAKHTRTLIANSNLTPLLIVCVLKDSHIKKCYLKVTVNSFAKIIVGSPWPASHSLKTISNLAKISLVSLIIHALFQLGPSHFCDENLINGMNTNKCLTWKVACSQNKNKFLIPQKRKESSSSTMRTKRSVVGF